MSEIGTADSLKEKGNEAYKKGRYDTAIHFYTESLQKQESAAWYILSMTIECIVTRIAPLHTSSYNSSPRQKWMLPKPSISIPCSQKRGCVEVFAEFTEKRTKTQWQICDVYGAAFGWIW